MKDALRKGSPEWYTPPHILAPLGEFDLDPCYPETPIHKTAKRVFTKRDDGLLQPWEGRVWMNPPYGNQVQYWIEKMALHNDGIALTFARTETSWFQRFIFPYANSILFLNKRITFIGQDGKPAKHNGGAPNVLIAYGEYNSEILDTSGHGGKHLPLKERVLLIDYNRTWRLIIRSVLIGERSLNEIYMLVESAAPSKVRGNSHWREKVRQSLRRYFTRIDKAKYKA